MTLLNVVLIGVIGLISGVLIAMKCYSNYHKELESSILYWRSQYEQSAKDANKIADAYEKLKEQLKNGGRK